jgi:putative ABC transport system ATP-binding protein
MILRAKPVRKTYTRGGGPFEVLRFVDIEVKAGEIVLPFFNLMPALSALENVALPLLLDGEPRATVLPAAQSLLDEMGLGERLECRPNQLSGPEMHRVVIARALIDNPVHVVSADPNGNLETKAAHALLHVFKKMTVAEKTRLVITHDASVGTSDRLIVVRDRVVEAA